MWQQLPACPSLCIYPWKCLAADAVVLNERSKTRWQQKATVKMNTDEVKMAIARSFTTMLYFESDFLTRTSDSNKF